MCYLRSNSKEIITKNIKRLLKEGLIIEIKINDDNNIIYYGMKEKFEFLLNHKQIHDGLHILSPFDNLIIQRTRLQRLFKFNYTVECYLPESKRQYGYFCLPLLHNDTFVARFDPKADRTNKIFYIKSFHPEKNWKITEECVEALAAKIKSFAKFNGCNKISVGINVPVQLKKMFNNDL